MYQPRGTNNQNIDKYLLEIAKRPRSHKPFDENHEEDFHVSRDGAGDISGRKSTEVALQSALWESLSEDMKRYS
jgi:hypothetical protein